MVGEEFLDRLEFYKSSWLPARAVVEEAVKARHKVQDCTLLFSCNDCNLALGSRNISEKTFQKIDCALLMSS